MTATRVSNPCVVEQPPLPSTWRRQEQGLGVFVVSRGHGPVPAGGLSGREPALDTAGGGSLPKAGTLQSPGLGTRGSRRAQPRLQCVGGIRAGRSRV